MAIPFLFISLILTIWVTGHDVIIYRRLDQERANRTQNSRSNGEKNDEIEYFDVRPHKHEEPLKHVSVEYFAGFGTAGLFHGERVERGYCGCKDTVNLVDGNWLLVGGWWKL